MSHSLPPTLRSRAVDDARDLITNPDAAALASESLRRLAWLILSSQRGITPQQRHRAPYLPGHQA